MPKTSKTSKFDPRETIVIDPDTGGQKGQKPERFDLIPWDAMEEVARVYHIGGLKHGDRNWLRGYKWSLSLAAAFRHLVKFALGHDRDDGPGGTGCLHLACAAWHCLCLMTFTLRGLGTDDRLASGGGSNLTQVSEDP